MVFFHFMVLSEVGQPVSDVSRPVGNLSATCQYRRLPEHHFILIFFMSTKDPPLDLDYSMQ